MFGEPRPALFDPRPGDDARHVLIEGKLEFRLPAVELNHPLDRAYAGKRRLDRRFPDAPFAGFLAHAFQPGVETVIGGKRRRSRQRERRGEDTAQYAPPPGASIQHGLSPGSETSLGTAALVPQDPAAHNGRARWPAGPGVPI